MPSDIAHTNSEKLPSQVLAGGITQPSYTRDFGSYGWNPRQRTPNVPREISLAASTVDLFGGTPKSTTYHIPGYSGFLPSSEDNPKAVDPGFRTEARETTKKYLRITYMHNIPGYAGSWNNQLTSAVVNDRGPIRPSSETTSATSYKAFGRTERTQPAVAPEFWGLPKIKSTFGRPSTQIHKRLLATSGRLAGGTAYTSTCDY